MSISSFDRFVLFVRERRLEQDGRSIRLGGRAFDILAVLVEKAPEIVSGRALLDRVWPDIAVDEAALRVHITALRRALGESPTGSPYIRNVPGRGYFLDAVVTKLSAVEQSNAMSVGLSPRSQLPLRIPPLLGRDTALREVGDLLAKHRFVTIVGPGGIGKTTVAVAVAYSKIREFSGAVYFFDLAPISEPELVVSAIASSLGLAVRSDDLLPDLVAFLKDRAILLVMDSCEHLLDGVAPLLETLYQRAPSVFILATSREHLHLDVERVFSLPPLESPPENSKISAKDALTFSAARLFVDRVKRTSHDFELTDDDAPVVARICQKLDGIALALELAAARVSSYGIEGTARLLENQFTLLWSGPRTAFPRHQTLRATLDWSFNLLSEFEQTVFRRLSIFVGMFNLQAAQFIVADEKISESIVLGAVESLVSKSLISTKTRSFDIRYRMLDTTRTYSAEKLIESGEHGDIAGRHMKFYLEILEGEMYSRKRVPLSEFSDKYTDQLGNIRSAIVWVFAHDADVMTKARMSVAAANLYISLSLLSECYNLAERSLDSLPRHGASETLEMYLQTLLGQSLMFIKGNVERSRNALLRGLSLAQALKFTEQELQLLGCLHLFHERMGDYNRAHEYALQGETIATRLGDPESMVAAYSLLGISCHLLGEQVQSRIHLYKVLSYPQTAKTQSSIRFGFDQYLRARIALARTIWILGFPDQAVVEAQRALEEARGLGHPVTSCMVLIWSISLFLWIGDLTAAKECLTRFSDLADAHSLTPYVSVAHGIEGQIAVKSGQADRGILFLQGAMQALRSARYELLTTDFLISEVEGYVLLGSFATAMARLDEAISSVENNGNHLYKSELLRMKGELISTLNPREYSESEELFLESIKSARAQSAHSLELRTAVSRLKFCSIDARSDRLADLASIYQRFKEGFATSDLIEARRFLE